MSSLTRLITVSLVLLLLLVGAGLGAQVWLRQQENRILSQAALDLSERLQHAIDLTGGISAPWPTARLEELAQLTGAEISIIANPAIPRDEMNRHRATIPLDNGKWLAARPATPPGERILNLFHRVVIALGVFAVLLVVALLLIAAIKPLRDRETRSPFTTRDRDMRSLSLLARTSVEQQAELDQERDERIRAEAEARHRLQLLNQALEEKIRMGRDLHDGVIQSLYAAGLTLQAAQQQATADPHLSTERLGEGLELINRTITDIRSYISGLTPRQVRRESLAQGFTDIVTELRAGRPLDLDLKIDEKASIALSDEQLSESMQIAREAVSNALRHGGAQRLLISLISNDDGTEFTIRDDGIGFDLAGARPGGHGLANMRARVERGIGRFEMKSAPGQGTHISIHWKTIVTS
ncbi:sensor histidine kinase [Synoicihabitans lomoniglobus]|uniref:Histidine kinase n=1 Tax=Synoicihabitans lomoniglobus TaxID=2909285 RepID=A0AAF0I4X4_9BACT|nr:histidine kinase [Opitutaceae bacterium LMO-M01]WED67063.1 histidine kinase [Opitutaceae bacterium LMO-M01]